MRKRAALESLREDINTFKEQHRLDRVVMIWCGSTEIFLEPSAAHMDIESFERAIDNDDLTIAPSMLYAYAALQEGVPFINGAPNLTVDIPVLERYAVEHRLPISRQGLQDRPDAHQVGAGPDVQGPHAGRRGLVLHQHPRQP